jgi:tetratricopeptide (TPR) repeat protein
MVQHLARRCWTAAAATLGLWSALQLGAAQAQAPTSSDAALELLVQHGINLRRVGKDDQALRDFERALALDPSSTRVRVHLAAAHQALGHWLEADRHLSEVLAREDDLYVQRHRATLERAREFVSLRLGMLDVIGEPAGAELFVNGRSIGRLPTIEPERLPVGSYTLEATMPGYYSVNRPIIISGRGHLRESIHLGPRESDDLGAANTHVAAEDSFPNTPRWLTWTLAGAGTAAAIGSVVAWSLREHHADRWNSAACVEPARRRGEVCPGELEAGRDAERVGYVTTIAAGLLLGGAAASWWFEAPPAHSNEARIARCQLALGEVRCFGSF